MSHLAHAFRLVADSGADLPDPMPVSLFRAFDALLQARAESILDFHTLLNFAEWCLQGDASAAPIARGLDFVRAGLDGGINGFYLLSRAWPVLVAINPEHYPHSHRAVENFIASLLPLGVYVKRPLSYEPV